MPDARCTRGLACKSAQKKAHTSIQVQRRQSGIPCAMVLRLMPCSPRRRIRLVTVIGGLAACPHPVGSTHLHQLDTSNGCQDHTVLPYAATSFVCMSESLTGNPALRFRFMPDAAASTASHPNVRDDGQRPSLRDETAEFVELIWVSWKQEYFLKPDLTGNC